MCHETSSMDSEEEGHEDDDEEEEEDAVNESWVEWVQRATHIAELAARKYQVTDWAAAHLSRKWRLAGHTARRTDHRWSTVALDFCVEGGVRRVGHISHKAVDRRHYELFPAGRQYRD